LKLTAIPLKEKKKDIELASEEMYTSLLKTELYSKEEM
jgi:hypothetical protein